MYGLKTAAHTLLDVLMPDGVDTSQYIKVSLVPFEGTVNIGSTYAATPPSWVDWSDQAQAKYNGMNFDRYNFGGTIGTKRVGHKWLFNKLTAKNSNVKWEGCVEMRADPYDILDTTPTSATPDTLFVPFFWPDEPDSNNDDGDDYQNNYLNDKGTFTTGGWSPDEYPDGAQKSLTKYYPSSSAANITFQTGAPDTTFPFENGPNYGCPKPIQPLTTSKSTVETAIDAMIGYPAMGTFIPTGLVWGWHVLTSNRALHPGHRPKSERLCNDGEGDRAALRRRKQRHAVEQPQRFAFHRLLLHGCEGLGCCQQPGNQLAAAPRVDERLHRHHEPQHEDQFAVHKREERQYSAVYDHVRQHPDLGPDADAELRVEGQGEQPALLPCAEQR